MTDDPRKEYGQELKDYLLVIDEKIGELNEAVSELRSAYMNLFATSDVDISGKDEPTKFISRLEHAKILRKKAEELF